MAIEPRILRQTHVGLFVNDLERSLRFYRDILGMVVTDHDEKAQLVFLSTDPEDEHHMVVLLPGRDAPSDSRLIQQVSFRCASLADVIGFWRRLTENNVKIIYTSTHGNAISCYFRDPDDNSLEVYWPTGLKATQGFLLGLDFSKTEAELMKQVEDAVLQHGVEGYVDMALLEQQNSH
ncbi:MULTISPECIES: VOC family protein [Burkholderia cepacia complex]|uniref:VOC family protein n=1 Tax=Burkholderia cepacia complex TaxID=87882 RepID=UPI0026DF7A06|nr:MULTISPECIES: VOC family protein [Burkholderia cepacia complex]MDO5948167.1 VOC family protein [Burkholderia cepacia]MDS0803606.1 VOC family protein [Burkholderia cenocepacia]